MTSAAATLGLVVAGFDVQQPDLGIFLEIKQGFNETPEVRGIDVVVPRADGRIARNRRADIRQIVLQGYVAGSGATHADEMDAFRANVLIMQAFFDPVLDPLELQVTDESGSIWTINARPLNTLWNERVQSVYADVSVALESVDPYWVAGGS